MYERIFSDSKSCAAYKLFNHNFHIGSVCKPENFLTIQSENLHMKRDLFVVYGYKMSALLKVN